VHLFLLPLLKGLLAVFVIMGVGELVLRFARVRNLPWYWKIALAALAGQATVTILVEIMLFSGAGSAGGLRLLLWLLVGAAICGHLTIHWAGAGRATGELFRADKFITAVLLLAVLTNLFVALAPSTKIDELYYHMLTPKRIVADGGLHFYLLPIESAVVPQMHYQIALSVAHAAGAPDAGNMLSWGYSVALILFLIGFLTDATKNSNLSLLCGSLCAVGIYGTVWHTTGGAHALGDLATVVALAGILRPEKLIDALGPYRFAFFLVTAASIAATTKLSLVPLSLIVSALIVRCVIRKRSVGTKVSYIFVSALLPWIVLHLPLMVWTYFASGSFWGPVFANVFGHSIFPPSILARVDNLLMFTWKDVMPAARYAITGFSPVFFISIIWILWTAFRGYKSTRVVAALLLLQGVLVAWKFHWDFRFLGGLEYGAVLAAFLTFTDPIADSGFSDAWARLSVRVADSRKWILLFAAIPWLGLQLYYAQPFVKVVAGLTTRSQFLERYVAFTEDFQQLDQRLPTNAVLYIANGHLPNFYAPRPVVLTPLDLHEAKSIFRLTLLSENDIERISATSFLKCGETIYSNDQAVIETYRAPGKNPLIGAVKVQECRIVAPDEK
jgi:hypothetical protein